MSGKWQLEATPWQYEKEWRDQVHANWRDMRFGRNRKYGKFALTTRMKKSTRVALRTVRRPASATVAGSQSGTDDRVTERVRAGKVRVALFPSFMYTKDPLNGELRGVVMEIAHALGASLGVEVLLVEYPTPPMMLEGLKAAASDVAFLGIDPNLARLTVGRGERGSGRSRLGSTVFGSARTAFFTPLSEAPCRR